ncbi:MAG: hypothetical protein C0623_13780 [Desulfuromonas sp.]|nr:MAG: hypothetical protein C0623_13780 [Desulfuromonas sp.]
MTCDALNLPMLVLQRELGPAVIEQNKLPCRGLFISQLLRSFRGMAVFAFLAIISLMAVIEPMTGVTSTRDLFPSLIRVTEGTADFPVPAQQRESRFFVVETGFCPGCGFMTVLALFAQTPLVRFNLLVTKNALAGSVPEFSFLPLFYFRFIEKLRLELIRIVAATALNMQVCTDQLKISLAMVKSLRVEQNDVGGPPLVLRVTQTALLLRRIPVSAMKPGLAPEIPVDLLVTVETKPAL